jgi:hypothetical protein
MESPWRTLEVCDRVAMHSTLSALLLISHP